MKVQGWREGSVYLPLFSTDQETAMNNIRELIQDDMALINNTHGLFVAVIADLRCLCTKHFFRLYNSIGCCIFNWEPNTARCSTVWDVISLWKFAIFIPNNGAHGFAHRRFIMLCSTWLCTAGRQDVLLKVPSMCVVVRLAGQAGERPDQVSPSCCLIIDPSGIVFSIVSIMMALVLLSTLASRHA